MVKYCIKEQDDQYWQKTSKIDGKKQAKNENRILRNITKKDDIAEFVDIHNSQECKISYGWTVQCRSFSGHQSDKDNKLGNCQCC